MSDFTELPDLACARLGGRVLTANDEFFAAKENLVADGPPVWDADRYTDRGKWMDGWETRRRRRPGHDWCLLRLGLPGVVHGVVVDTSHFRGNYPESCSLGGCEVAAEATAGELEGPQVEWHELVPRTELAGNSENRFAVAVPYRVTHLRLRIYPDGGVARLRVHGRVLPRAAELTSSEPVDLASVALGARVVAASDRFYSSPGNLLLPGEPRGMFDGWETRRRRGPGNDWVTIELAAAGRPRRVVIDTSYFQGNAPASCSLEGASAAAAGSPEGAVDEALWRPLLAPTDLRPHELHEFAIDGGGDPVRYVRLQIYPDGGIARLRVLGQVGRREAERLALAELNALAPAAARGRLHDCCGSRRWAGRMADRRPFAGREELLAAADEEADRLERGDWLEAFAAHLAIGGGDAERPRGKTAAAWSQAEQSGAAAADASVRRRLADGNRRYRDRFGYLYIVCASGMSGDGMLARLEQRLENDPDDELAVAAGEERKITRLRLAKLLGRGDRS